MSLALRSPALLFLASLFGLSREPAGITVQEAILRAKPAVVVVISRVDADITMNCGKGPVTVKPTPFVETGSGWFVDGRGYLVTNAHVVDPAHAGAVEIRQRFGGGDKILTTLHAGELFGEMALFRKSPRSASAVAVDRVELLVIRGERLEWLMRNRPQLMLEVVKRLSEIVVATDRDQSEQAVR